MKPPLAIWRALGAMLALLSLFVVAQPAAPVAIDGPGHTGQDSRVYAAFQNIHS